MTLGDKKARLNLRPAFALLPKLPGGYGWGDRRDLNPRPSLALALSVGSLLSGAQSPLIARDVSFCFVDVSLALAAPLYYVGEIPPPHPLRPRVQLTNDPQKMKTGKATTPAPVFIFWGDRRDLNPRPPGPQPGALPG